MILAHQKRLPEVQRTRFSCTTITIGARCDIINYQSYKTVSNFPGIMQVIIETYVSVQVDCRRSN